LRMSQVEETGVVFMPFWGGGPFIFKGVDNKGPGLGGGKSAIPISPQVDGCVCRLKIRSGSGRKKSEKGVPHQNENNV